MENYRRDEFAKLHPIIIIGFFLCMVVSTMVFFDMVFLGISFVAAFSYGVFSGGRKFIKMFFIFVVPVMIISIIINMYLNYSGTTIMFYFLQKPITLEGMLYGITTAVAFGTVLMWFYTYSYVVTSDKFLYVFGKILPTLSLVFSMVLRFIPLFHKRAVQITTGQKCIGQDVGAGNSKEKIRRGIKVLSIMTTWSLENSIDTSDSMKARGYGLSGRTIYNKYTFARRDLYILLVLAILMFVIFFGIPHWGLEIIYYPQIVVEYKSYFWISVYIGALSFAFMPILINVKEEMKWKYLESKI